MSEKTIGEWLKELPEPYRTAAISQVRKQCNEENKISSIHKAIDEALAWGSTKEGWGFWNMVYNHYYKPNDLPPYPEGLKNELLLADMIKATKEIINKLELLTEIGAKLGERGNKTE